MNERYYEINRRLRFEQRVTLDFPFHLHNDVELIYCLKGSACACCDGKEYTIPADSVILSTGYKSAPLADKGSQIYVVGDAHKVGNLRSVIWQAWDVCMKL